MLDVGCWIFSFLCDVLSAWCWVFGCWIFLSPCDVLSAWCRVFGCWAEDVCWMWGRGCVSDVGLRMWIGCWAEDFFWMLDVGEAQAFDIGCGGKVRYWA
jgi:hypothetical protein